MILLDNVPQEITLATIEAAARAYAREHAALSETVTALTRAIEDLKRRQLPIIKRQVAAAAAAQLQLHSLVDNARHLFTQPKTVVFHGIKVGLRKGPGGITWDDPDKVVELIEKHLPKAQAELLVKTTKKPIKKAIEDLDIATLKRIGCRVEETGEQIVIKPTDGDVEKIVTALLEEATAETN